MKVKKNNGSAFENNLQKESFPVDTAFKNQETISVGVENLKNEGFSNFILKVMSSTNQQNLQDFNSSLISIKTEDIKEENEDSFCRSIQNPCNSPVAKENISGDKMNLSRNAVLNLNKKDNEFSFIQRIFSPRPSEENLQQNSEDIDFLTDIKDDLKTEKTEVKSESDLGNFCNSPNNKNADSSSEEFFSFFNFSSPLQNKENLRNLEDTSSPKQETESRGNVTDFNKNISSDGFIDFLNKFSVSQKSNKSDFIAVENTRNNVRKSVKSANLQEKIHDNSTEIPANNDSFMEFFDRIVPPQKTNLESVTQLKEPAAKTNEDSESVESIDFLAEIKQSPNYHSDSTTEDFSEFLNHSPKQETDDSPENVTEFNEYASDTFIDILNTFTASQNSNKNNYLALEDTFQKDTQNNARKSVKSSNLQEKIVDKSTEIPANNDSFMEFFDRIVPSQKTNLESVIQIKKSAADIINKNFIVFFDRNFPSQKTNLESVLQFKETASGINEIEKSIKKSKAPEIRIISQKRQKSTEIIQETEPITNQLNTSTSSSAIKAELNSEIRKTIELFKSQSENFADCEIVNVLADNNFKSPEKIAPLSRNNSSKNKGTLINNSFAETSFGNISNVSKVVKFSFFDRHNKNEIIAQLFNETDLKKSVDKFKKFHLVNESREFLKEISALKGGDKNNKPYIKRYKKGKVNIYKIKQRKVKRPKKPETSIEDETDFNAVFTKFTDESNDFDFNNISSDYLSKSSSRRSSVKSVLTEHSKTFSTGTSENFNEAQKKLRQGVNKACKNRSLLYEKNEESFAPEPNRRYIKMKIEEILLNVYEDLAKGDKNVHLKVRLQTFNNCDFMNNILQLKPIHKAKHSIIYFKHAGSKYKFALIMHLLDKIRTLLENDSKVTKRELYYQTKQLVPNQQAIDRAINAISCLLDVGQWSLNITAQKGLVYGDMTIIFNSGEKLNCNIPGILIPLDINSIIKIHSNAYFILIVEKESIFHKLLEEDLPNRLTRPFIMITGKGFPDLNTQMFVRKLWMLMSIPVFILVDADPDGINIMINYRYGSLKNAHISKYLAVPNARWLGVFPSEISKFGIKRQTLTERERNVIKSLLETPYCKENKKIADELNILLEQNYKAGIEGLMFNNSFLSDVYIPTKFYNEDYV